MQRKTQKGAVTAKPPSAALTNDWKGLEKQVMICSGSFSQAHKRYKGHNQQSAATCIVACVFSALKPMNTWTREVLDEILEVGTDLHLKSRQVSENRCLDHMEPPKIYKYFYLGNNKVSTRVGINVVAERVPRDTTMLQKIEAMLYRFFLTNVSGIVGCQHTYFAIWKHGRHFFIFDSTEHNHLGGKWDGLPGLGYCYCIRVPTTRLLADIILKNSPLKPINKFIIYPCILEKVVKVNTTPPETVDGGTPAPPETPKPRLKTTRITKIAEPKVEEIKVEELGGEVEPKKSISKSRIPPERPKLESTTHFTKLPVGTTGILRASTHQRDPRFTRNNGAQAMANAMAALTMLRQYKSKQWIRKILDDILKLGEVIHHESKSLPKGQIVDKITLNDKEYSPKIDKYGCVGRLTSDDDKIFNLEQAVTNVLIDTDCCILIGPNIVALWRENGRYYMFDPDERTPIGSTIKPGDPPGVACVTWFNKPSDLVALYLSNVPKNTLKDRFLICKVKIKDYVQVPEDWYNFKALKYNKWILRGNFSQQDRRFPPESRNAQCTANATMALTYKELKEEKEWDDRTVDQVLLSGDEFYHGSVAHLQETGRFKHKYLMVDEVKRDFDVENKKVNLEIDDCLVNGIINAKSDTGIPNLKRGFEQFFTDSDGGIVTANLQSMAVWKRDGTYYYYDSHSRDDKGVVCGFGTACILRLLTIEDLANALMTNLGADRQNFYNISRVVVKLMDITEDGVVKPPLNYYELVNEFVAILRANINERDKKFTINSGKQTVPMCLAALAFNTLTPSFDWTKEDVDQILTFGDKLYTSTMEEMYSGETLEGEGDEVTSSNVKKEVQIGSNLLAFELEDVSSGNFEDNLKEALESLSLRVGEEGNEVFQSILESPMMTVSLWRDENLIYLFDSKPRDERGQIYGKDEWSAKVVVAGEGQDEEEGEEGEAEDEAKDTWGDEGGKDEMGGGDNLGEPEDDENLDEDEEDEAEGDDVPPLEKKGSDFWRTKEQEGKACVLRFSRIDDLVQHLLDNSPPNKRSELEFTLKSVKVVNTPIVHEIFDPEVEDKTDEIAGDWNEFKEFDRGKWILRSVRNLRDGLFPVCNRGKQSLPMCLVSLAFASLFALEKFTQEVVDNILSYGDRLYTVVRKLRAKELKESLELSDDEIEQILKDSKFELRDYPKRICMGEKLAIWEGSFEVIVGDITSKEPESVPNVTSGLETFFGEHQFGILACKDHPVGVWKTDDVFYMFDPHANGPSGVKTPVGVSCITRFVNLEDLTRTYTQNLPKYGNNFFEIHSFTFTHDKCVRERHPEEKEEKVPKIGGFNPVMAGKSILRGDVKLDCTKFDRGVHIHSAAIAYVALALSLSKDPETWTKIIIREILTVGEELHNDSVDRLEGKFDPWKDRLGVRQVKTDFSIGRLKVNCALRFTEQKGIVDIKNAKTPNLRQGMERFFEENSHGILVVDKFILPVWEQMKGDEVSIFMFDPNSRGATGLPSQGGNACIMKFCNSKVASDHIKACMMDIDKARAEFVIIPIEIVVGSARTKRKAVCPPQKKTIKTPVVHPKTIKTPVVRSTQKTLQESQKQLLPTKVKPVCPDKETLQQVQKELRRAAEEERRKAEAKRCYALGRSEMYQINDDTAIIRATRPVQAERDLPVNVAALVLMRIASDLSKWTYKQMEVVIETGYQLYVDSYNAYKPTTSKLLLPHVLRRVLLRELEVKIDIRRPVDCGPFTKKNVMAQVSHFFTSTNFFFLNYEEFLISLYFKSGYYFMFDPYSRDLNGNKCEKGSAVLMRFGSLEGLVEKILRNLGPEEGPVGHFALIVAGILSVERLTK
ncbi:hypothetical protein TcasGA2_TC014944 [Tribolium castaneum]|uniref:Uncharacterized protein n=1 Tax=Tribolium castaneum TaxID=7070 RepID=D2A3U7_TRICA|nr:PREDICTED: uncharacterized protein LOC103313436 [Tribolium castaneum]EFA04883.1 hypothetical protein TcasGA2_TC014944 [Tribolium castaneum]|eukprot:XP_008194915.1 PREDICTED: uncharacterized protein LOC103313436 [Tribolium castaneum]